jgi:hypothetical protein
MLETGAMRIVPSCIALIQMVLILLVGRLGYKVYGPRDIPVLVLVLVIVVGMLAFTGLGVGVSTLVPNADAVGTVVSLVFFILVALSGLYFPVAFGTSRRRPALVSRRSATSSPSRHSIVACVDSFNGIPGHVHMERRTGDDHLGCRGGRDRPPALGVVAQARMRSATSQRIDGRARGATAPTCGAQVDSERAFRTGIPDGEGSAVPSLR